nr:ribonuclease H-like domain-containing protein [Tanacetum cinerariifolium]
MSDHEDETITAENAPPKNIPQITTVTNISAKFPCLKKGEYDIWAMKMQNFIYSSDLLCWNIVLKGNSAKPMTTDKDGNLKIRPPVTTEEHQQVQREEKTRTILLSALSDEHMGDFYHMIDARDVWNAIKARFGNDGYGGYTTTLSASPGSSSFKGSSKSKCSVVDDVIYSFFANHEIDQQLVYEDLDQMNKEEFEEYDLKHQMAMLSIKVHRFEKKHGRKIKFNGRENARFDKKLVKCFNCKKMGHFSRECRAQGGQNSNNYQKYKEAGKDGTDSKSMIVVDGNADSEGEVVFTDDVIPVAVYVSAGLVVAAATDSPHSETEFAFKGLSTEAKWNNSGKNLYKLIDSSMSVRTKRGLGLDKYIGEGELGIDDSKFSIFHTNSDELEGQPNYNSDRSSTPSTNDFQTCDSSQECSRPNHSNHDSNDSISNVFAPASESKDTIVIDCARQEDFPSDHSLRLEKAKDKGIVDSGCSRSMSGNKDKLEDFEDFHGGESHMVLFTENECLVLSKDFPLPDPSMVILSIPRKHNLYTFRLNELAPKGPLTCLIAKASQNESTLWHKRLGHVNFRNINKLVKGNLVRGLPSKGIRWDYSNARTPQQNGVAERKNRTLIEAARTMLADSLLPTIFWSEAVATACYVLNRVLVTKPHHKTPYELLTGDKPSISYLKPFGCHVTILNTSDTLGKFDKKSNEGYIVGYSISSKAYRQEQAGKEEADRLGLAFPSLNPMLGVGTSSISSFVSAGSTPSVSAGSTPQMSPCASFISADRHSSAAGKCHVPTDRPVSIGRPTGSAGRPVSVGRPTGFAGRPVSAGRPPGSAGRPVSAGRPSGSADRSSIPDGHILGQSNASTSSERFSCASSMNKSDIHDGLTIFDCPKSGIFTTFSYDEDFYGPDANNLESSLNVSSTITKRIHNIHPTSQAIGDINSLVHTKSQALADPDWVEAMQSKMQQFMNQKVWVLVPLPDGKRAIGTKWILKNK